MVIKEDAELARLGNVVGKDAECTCLDDLDSRASPVEAMMGMMKLESMLEIRIGDKTKRRDEAKHLCHEERVLVVGHDGGS